MSYGSMDNGQIDRETYGLLVQLARQKFGTKVEIVGMKLANRRTDYAVFLATKKCGVSAPGFRHGGETPPVRRRKSLGIDTFY